MPEYVDEGRLTTSLSGERGRVFDPIASAREALAGLATVEKSHDTLVGEISTVIDDDLGSDPLNRQRVDKALTLANHPQLARELNTRIKSEFNSEESRQQAGALAELYIRTLRTFRLFELIEESRSKGSNKFNRFVLLDSCGDHWESCLQFAKFINRRNSQDKLRFATAQDSDKRLPNYFDRVIRLANDVVGIKHTAAHPDGIPAMNFSRMSASVKPYDAK